MRLVRKLPGSVRSALDLGSGERPLAFAHTQGGSYVVATSTALHFPAGPGSPSFVRLPWEQIDHATWRDGWLHFNETAGGGEHRVRLVDPGSVPETVRERVTATIVVNHHAVLRGGGNVRIIGRRTPGAGSPHWTFVFDAGLDPADPGLRAEAEQILENLRRQTGL